MVFLILNTQTLRSQSLLLGWSSVLVCETCEVSFRGKRAPNVLSSSFPCRPIFRKLLVLPIDLTMIFSAACVNLVYDTPNKETQCQTEPYIYSSHLEFSISREIEHSN